MDDFSAKSFVVWKIANFCRAVCVIREINRKNCLLGSLMKIAPIDKEARIYAIVAAKTFQIHQFLECTWISIVRIPTCGTTRMGDP